MTCPTQAWLNNAEAFFFINGAQPLIIGGVRLTEEAGVLLSNDAPIPSSWSLYNTIGNVIHFDESNVLQVIGGFLYFNDQIIATTGDLSNISDWSLYPAIAPVQMIAEDIVWTVGANSYTLNGSSGSLLYNGVAVGGENWSLYPAIQDVNFAGYNLNNADEITCKKIFGNGTSNTYSNILEVLADGNIYVKPGDLTNVTTESVCLIQTTGGLRGRVIIEGNPGGGGFLSPGIVDIIANPAISPDGNIGSGGTVNVIANSAIGLSPELTQTSKVVLSGASVLSYAGYVTPILSTAGYNYIWGGVGVNIQCDVIPPIVPNVPGTIYMLGRLGVAIGTASTLGTNYGLFASLIQPYSDGLSRPDLIISGKFSANVILRDVAEIVGDGCVMTNIASINGGPYVSGANWAQWPAVADVNFNFRNLSNVNKINGSTYASGANWFNYPALNDVDMSNFSINNLKNINGALYEPLSNWSAYTALTDININSNSLSNVNQINGINYTPTLQWAAFPAFQSVEMNEYNINNAAGIQGSFEGPIRTLAVQADQVNVTGNVFVLGPAPTESNELVPKSYVDGLLADANGTSTVTNPFLTTAFQIIGSTSLTIVGGTKHLVANASVMLQTNTNTIRDVTMYYVCDGATIGSQMRSSFGGINHWLTMPITAYSLPLPPGTHTVDLYARASANGTIVVDAMNLNIIST